MATITKREIKQIILEELGSHGKLQMKGRYLTMTEVKGGMEVALTPAGKKELVDLMADNNKPEIYVFCELAEDISANSDWMIQDGDALGQMTSAPCILTDSGYRDDGEIDWNENSRLFGFMDYQVDSLLEKLLEGPVFFVEAN